MVLVSLKIVIIRLKDMVLSPSTFLVDFYAPSSTTKLSVNNYTFAMYIVKEKCSEKGNQTSL